MNKEALFSQYTPMQILLNTALVGGGSFAAMRLLKDIMTQAAHQGKPEETKSNALTVDIPKTHPQIINPDLQKIAATTMEGLLATGVGGIGGFMGTKMLYDAWRKKQMQHEVDKAEASYLKTLADVSKTATDSTPNIDKWCEKTAEYINKKGALNWAGLLGGVKKLTPTIVKDHPYLTGGGTLAGLGELYANKHPQSAISQQMAAGPTSAGAISEAGRSVIRSDKLWNAWTLAGGSMATLALAALINSHNKKIHKEDKQPPANVAINYV